MGLILLIFGMGFHYRNGLAYYFSFKSYNTDEKAAEAKRISDVRNYQVLENHKGKAIGLDVSEFQETIDWNSVGTIENNYPIEFVFIRATAGNDRVDGKLMIIGLVPKKEQSSVVLIITIVPMKIHYSRLDFLSKQSIFTKGICHQF